MTFRPVTGAMLCTGYVALDPIDAGNGAVEYVAGSHRWGEFRQAPFREGGASARRYVASPLAALPDIWRAWAETKASGPPVVTQLESPETE